MTTYIKHADYNDSEFRLFLSAYRDDKLKEYVSKNLDKYTTVASPSVRGTLSAILEESFSITNSIDSCWYEDGNACATELATKGCRSTSVGDIIVVNDILYVVNGFGFIRLDTKE